MTNRGVGVQVATHVLNLELELLLRPVGGALYRISDIVHRGWRFVLMRLYLEGKVLEEVSSAVVLVRLGPGTGVDPHADSRGLGPWRVISSDLLGVKSEKSVQSHVVVGVPQWSRRKGRRTVRPFLRVVVWVLPGAGEAKPLVRGAVLVSAALLRRPCERFKASLRDAMAELWRI